jgi:diphthamide synthase (EF-2-diphthine--ammonia ligase)
LTASRKAYFNWSGGKDSSLALCHVLQNKTIDVELLLTTVNAQVNRISMHGVRTELLQQQAKSIGIPIREIRLPEIVSMDEYNNIMYQSVNALVAEEFHHTVFGDIFLEDLRKYREQQLAPFGLQVHFPLWQRNTKGVE